jgi:hypothetical protein
MEKIEGLADLSYLSAGHYSSGQSDAIPHIGLSFTLIDFVVSGAECYCRVLA